MIETFVVLVVDDHANNRFSLRTLLSRLPDCRVEEADSGEAALLAAVDQDIHLILLDVQMPGMDGFETARHLQMTERTRHIPVVFVTAVFKAEEFVRRGFDLGAVDYLTKPIDDHLLLSRVRLYQHLYQRELMLEAALRLVNVRETALIEARDAAEAANRAKSTFLSNMSHELRTPLHAVIGFSQLMSRSVTIGDDEKQKLAIINRSGKHLLTLINDVLELSKIDAGHVQLQATATDLRGLLTEVTDMLHARAEQAGLSLTLHMSDLPAGVCVDGTKLRQVLINLLGNAIKFTRHGGVTLTVAGRPAAAGAGAGAAHIEFIVSDTGIGITPEDQQRIFDPFVQINPHATTAGTGLGLTITRQYLAMLEGTLTVESTPGVGSVFRFALTLPTTAAPAATAPLPGEVIGLPAADRGKRILIADDNVDARLLLQQLLVPLGLQVAEADDGMAAVALAESFHPDLILMDWRMPHLDGLAAVRQIRQQQGATSPKIVMLTASAFAEQREQALDGDVDDYLRKPVVEAELYAALEAHLGMRFERARAAVPPAPTFPPGLAAAVTPEALAALPETLRAELCAAVEELNSAKLGAVLARIAREQPQLAHGITALTEAFRYQDLMERLFHATTADAS